MKGFFLISISTIAFSGCFQQIAVSSLGGIMQTGFEVLNQEQDRELADRSIASNLKLIETILEKDPDNTHYLLLASIGYSSYALGFVEDDSIERARLFYWRAKEFGLRILRRHDRVFQLRARIRRGRQYRAGPAFLFEGQGVRAPYPAQARSDCSRPGPRNRGFRGVACHALEGGRAGCVLDCRRLGKPDTLRSQQFGRDCRTPQGGGPDAICPRKRPHVLLWRG